MERYQISLNATDLPNASHLFRKSSPYAKLKVVSGSMEGTNIGTTQSIPNCLSPDWCEIFFLEFGSSEVTNIEVSIWNKVDGGKDYFIGSAVFEATTVFQEPGRTASEQIGRRTTSRLFMHVEKSRIGSATGKLDLRLRGLDMKNVEPGIFGLGRSDPFYEISKKDTDYSISHVKWNVVYRSETVHNHLNPSWKPASIGVEELCYGKLECPLRIQVLDYNDNGKHKVIGEYETTVTELQSHISVKGNADRDQAIQLGREEGNETYGLLCVLQATLSLEKSDENV